MASPPISSRTICSASTACPSGSTPSGVYNNGGFQINPHTPFGGIGISGFGKEGGKAGIDEFLHYKTVTIGVGAPIFPK
ncbi:aldehyde dehydrogenase family protein [Sphingopyxis sp. PET50]|uniref:aldehyde dehydrogenase family protein n=1 Tax=Sphingopyxis sp. PET50 TaxID=2976533 RepID=UPI00391A6FB7